MARQIPQDVLDTLRQSERDRLAQFNPATWRDSDGNLVAPMKNEPNQQMTDEEFAAMLRKLR
jgi:hypothetical protein